MTRPLIKRLSYSNKPAIIRKKIEQIKRKQHILNHRIIQSGRIRYGMFHVFSFLYGSPRGDYSDEGDEVYIRGFSASARWSIRGPNPPLRLGILIFQKEKKEKKKRREEALALPSKGACLALHGLFCALPSDPPACPRSGAAALIRTDAQHNAQQAA